MTLNCITTNSFRDLGRSLNKLPPIRPGYAGCCKLHNMDQDSPVQHVQFEHFLSLSLDAAYGELLRASATPSPLDSFITLPTEPSSPVVLGEDLPKSPELGSRWESCGTQDQCGSIPIIQLDPIIPLFYNESGPFDVELVESLTAALANGGERLVGIEENPGPKPQHGKGKNKNKGKKAGKKKQNRPRPSQSIPDNRGPSSKGLVPGLLGGIGRAAGSMFGFGDAGQKVGNWLGSITGMGAYKVRSNSLMNSGAPTFGSGSMRIKHREYLTDVSGSATFTNSSFPINPGLYNTFPFLSSLAQNFQEYKFHGLVFYFNSTSANALNSTNTALGTLIMSTNYNSVEPNFTSKVQMEAFEFSNSGTPSMSQIHCIECDPRQNALGELYVRTGSLELNSDQRLYDLGVFQLATVGMQATANVGELWVSYDVTLYKPKLPDQLVGSDVQYAHLSEFPLGTAANGTFFGTGGGVVSTTSTLPVVTSNNTFTLPYAGSYLVLMTSAGAQTAGISLSIGANISNGSNLFQDSSVSSITAVAGGTNLTTFIYNVSQNGIGIANKITVTSATGLTAGKTDTFIFAFPQLYSVTSPFQIKLENMVRQIIDNDDMKMIRVDDAVEVVPKLKRY